MKSTSLIISVLLALLVGCSGGQSPSSSAGGGSDGPSAEPGECDVIGAWVGPVPAGILAGRTLTMVFSEDGTAQGTCDRVTLNSTWQRSGNTVQVIDVNARPPFASCDPALVGRYTLEFAADCSSVSAVSGEDPCEHRQQALLGFRATRQ